MKISSVFPDGKKVYKMIGSYIYDVSNQIGSGFSSRVYKGQNKTNKQVVAIKVIDLKQVCTPISQTLLKNEINVLRRINHPNLMKVHDIFVTKNNTYIVSELCEQGDLADLIKKRKQISQIEALSLMTQILMGMKALSEQNIIHRDIKPANILISKDIIKLADFGFAIDQNDQLDQSILRSFNVGTPLYMSPETVLYNQYSEKSDVWSLGILLYEMLHGQPPFAGSSDSQLLNKYLTTPVTFPVQQKITKDAKNLIQNMLMIDQNQRFSLDQVMDAVSKITEKTRPLCKVKRLSPKSTQLHKVNQITRKDSPLKLRQNLSRPDKKSPVRKDFTQNLVIRVQTEKDIPMVDTLEMKKQRFRSMTPDNRTFRKVSQNCSHQQITLSRKNTPLKIQDRNRDENISPSPPKQLRNNFRNENQQPTPHRQLTRVNCRSQERQGSQQKQGYIQNNFQSQERLRLDRNQSIQKPPIVFQSQERSRHSQNRDKNQQISKPPLITYGRDTVFPLKMVPPPTIIRSQSFQNNNNNNSNFSISNNNFIVKAGNTDSHKQTLLLNIKGRNIIEDQQQSTQISYETFSKHQSIQEGYLQHIGSSEHNEIINNIDKIQEDERSQLQQELEIFYDSITGDQNMDKQFSEIAGDDYKVSEIQKLEVGDDKRYRFGNSVSLNAINSTQITIISLCKFMQGICAALESDNDRYQLIQTVDNQNIVREKCIFVIKKCVAIKCYEIQNSEAKEYAQTVIEDFSKSFKNILQNLHKNNLMCEDKRFEVLFDNQIDDDCSGFYAIFLHYISQTIKMQIQKIDENQSGLAELLERLNTLEKLIEEQLQNFNNPEIFLKFCQTKLNYQGEIRRDFIYNKIIL